MKRDRIEEIADLLDKRGKLTLEQLDGFFPHVSQMTLRRDLLQLEQAGRIIRVRGGAMSVSCPICTCTCLPTGSPWQSSFRKRKI